jgi:hypothetical protein
MGACANHRDAASASPRGRAHLAFPLPELESDRRERFFARACRSHARFPSSALPSEQVSLATRSTSAAPPVASRSPGARRGSECTSRARSAREPTRPGSFPAQSSFLGLRAAPRGVCAPGSPRSPRLAPALASSRASAGPRGPQDADRPLPASLFQVRARSPAREHQALFPPRRPRRALPRRQQEVPRAPPGHR